MVFLNLSIQKCTCNIILYSYIHVAPQVIEVSLLRLSLTSDQPVLSKALAPLNLFFFYSLQTKVIGIRGSR